MRRSALWWMLLVMAMGASPGCWADFPDSRYVSDSGNQSTVDSSSVGGGADHGTVAQVDTGSSGNCTLGSAPRCQGDNLAWCSSAGTLRTTRCPSGCKAGACCKDNDGDGVSKCKGDCDDNDRLVFPQQMSYFDTPRKSGGFDYNCNKQEEKEFTAKHTTCTRSGGTCNGAGWQDKVPGCGEQGTWVTCSRSGRNCNSGMSTRRQRCR